MNEYDSEKISELVTNALGFSEIDSPKQAALIIVNTCSVREKAQEKLFSDLGRFRLLKKRNPELVIAVGGCVAVQEKSEILKRAPYVDLIFGPQTLQHLPEMYFELKQKQHPIININTNVFDKFNYFPKPHAKGPSAFVSIMEGCNKFCSYCIVPFTRGREVSRPVADVLQEISELAQQGVKEINLLGQNVNAYSGIAANNHPSTLAELLLKIAEIPNIQRIRFTTSHPAAFTDDLIQAYAAEPKIVNHLHLPVQSGSNRILKLMRRGYTAEEYIEKINKLKSVRPGISISSDFIVGFPGETANDFQDTLNLVKTIGFDASFSFIYSARPNTRAAKLLDDISLAEKQERLQILQNLLASSVRKISNSMLGTKPQILVLGRAKKNSQQQSGRTENNRVVNFTSTQNLTGELVTVLITEALSNSLRGILEK